MKGDPLPLSYPFVEEEIAAAAMVRAFNRRQRPAPPENVGLNRKLRRALKRDKRKIGKGFTR